MNSEAKHPAGRGVTHRPCRGLFTDLLQLSIHLQATNAALAALAAAGNSFALGQLWTINEDFIRRKAWQWYNKNKDTADRLALTFEDLVQEGYFALVYQ